MRFLPSVSFVLLVLVLAVFHRDVQAQNAFVPAIVVSADGDTLRGAIGYEGWIRTPDAIVFREERDGETVRLAPGDVARFTVADERYVSVEATIDQNPVEPSEITDERRPPVRRQVFMQVLVDGPLALYTYSDFKRHFFVRADGRVRELEKWYATTQGRRVAVGWREGRMLVTQHVYRDQLAELTASCAQVMSTSRTGRVRTAGAHRPGGALQRLRVDG